MRASFSRLPDDFDINLFVKSFRGIQLDDSAGGFGELKNKAVDSAISNIDMFSALIQIVWFKIYSFMQSNFKENIQDVRFSVQDLKCLFQQSQDMVRCNEFQHWLRLCFMVPSNVELSEGETSVGFDIVMGVLENPHSCSCRGNPESFSQ